MTAIELFQDFLVTSRNLSCDELLTSIRKHTRVPWLEASEDKSEIPEGIVRFDRERGADISAARANAMATAQRIQGGQYSAFRESEPHGVRIQRCVE